MGALLAACHRRRPATHTPPCPKAEQTHASSFEKAPLEVWAVLVGNCTAWQVLQLRILSSSAKQLIDGCKGPCDLVKVAAFLGEENTIACLEHLMQVFPTLQGLEFTAFQMYDFSAPRPRMAIAQMMKTLGQMTQLQVLSFCVENADPEPLSEIGKLVHLSHLSLNAPATDDVLGTISRGCLRLRCLEVHVRKHAGAQGMQYIAQGSTLITCLKLSDFQTSSDMALASIIRHCPDVHELECTDLAVGGITLEALMLSPRLKIVGFIGCHGLDQASLNSMVNQSVTLKDLTICECGGAALDLTSNSHSIESLFLENQAFDPWHDLSCLALWPSLKQLLLYGYTEPLFLSLVRSAHSLRHLQSVTWSCGYKMPENERQTLQQDLSPCSLCWDGMPQLGLPLHCNDAAPITAITTSAEDLQLDAVVSPDHLIQHFFLSVEGAARASEEESTMQQAALKEEEAARVAEEQWATNIEATIGAQRTKRTSATNFASGTEEEEVFIRQFTRSPGSFRQALLGSEPLQQCCNTLLASGLSAELASGALAFVAPHILPHVEEAASFQGIQLKRHHVVCSRNLYPAVTAAVGSLRSNDNVRQRNQVVLRVLDVVATRAFFSRDASAVQIIVGSVPMEVRNTFLNIPIRSEIPRSATTQSTGDAHGIANPRHALMASSSV